MNAELAADPDGSLHDPDGSLHDPDGSLHDAARYPEKDRPQVHFDKKRHDDALRFLPKFREMTKTGRTSAQLEFLTDATLLRYLRARDSNLEAAAKMLEATLAWRAKHFDSEDRSERCCQQCAEDARSHCFFQLFTDTAGRKVVYSCAARARNKVVEDNMMHMAWEIEHLFGGRNANPGKVIWMVDMNGFGMRDLNPAMARATFPLFSNHFPERMSQIVLLDAPIIFSGLYKVALPLMDPVTRNKVVMLKGHTQRKAWLEEHIGKDSGAAEWLEQVLKLPARPGSYPPESVCSGLSPPRARLVLERCRCNVEEKEENEEPHTMPGTDEKVRVTVGAQSRNESDLETESEK